MILLKIENIQLYFSNKIHVIFTIHLLLYYYIFSVCEPVISTYTTVEMNSFNQIKGAFV